MSRRFNCAQGGCDKLAFYSTKGYDFPTHCADHKASNMINPRKPFCVVDDCTNTPKYALPGKFPSRCEDHRQESMIIFPRTKCKFQDCPNTATYSDNKKRPRHCVTHKEAKEISMVLDTCLYCYVPHILNHSFLCKQCS